MVYDILFLRVEEIFMRCRTGHSFAVTARAVAYLVAIALLWFMPRLSVAQSPLPIQWMYGAIIEVNSVAYSPNGALMAVGGYGGIQLYNVSTGDLVTSLPTTANSYVYSLAFSPDGTTLAAGGGSTTGTANSSGVVELWSVSTHKLISSLATTALSVCTVAFSPDGSTLADGGSNRSGTVLELWNVSTGNLTTTLGGGADGIVYSVAFSPSGTMLAEGAGLDSLGESSGLAQVWNITTGKVVTTFSTAAIYGVNSVAFSPDGTMLADGGYGLNGQGDGAGIVELWNASTGAAIRSFPTSDYVVLSVAFSPDGTKLADCGGLYNDEEISDVQPLERLHGSAHKNAVNGSDVRRLGQLHSGRQHAGSRRRFEFGCEQCERFCGYLECHDAEPRRRN